MSSSKCHFYNNNNFIWTTILYGPSSYSVVVKEFVFILEARLGVILFLLPGKKTKDQKKKKKIEKRNSFCTKKYPVQEFYWHKKKLLDVEKFLLVFGIGYFKFA